jgi:hypothetical protein
VALAGQEAGRARCRGCLARCAGVLLSRQCTVHALPCGWKTTFPPPRGPRTAGGSPPEVHHRHGLAGGGGGAGERAVGVVEQAGGLGQLHGAAVEEEELAVTCRGQRGRGLGGLNQPTCLLQGCQRARQDIPQPAGCNSSARLRQGTGRPGWRPGPTCGAPAADVGLGHPARRGNAALLFTHLQRLHALRSLAAKHRQDVVPARMQGRQAVVTLKRVGRGVSSPGCTRDATPWPKKSKQESLQRCPPLPQHTHTHLMEAPHCVLTTVVRGLLPTWFVQIRRTPVLLGGRRGKRAALSAAAHRVRFTCGAARPQRFGEAIKGACWTQPAPSLA